MPSPFTLYPYQAGDQVMLKKQHPCGSFLWIVVRSGAQITLRCALCGRQMVMPRQALEKATKKVDRPTT